MIYELYILDATKTPGAMADKDRHTQTRGLEVMIYELRILDATKTPVPWLAKIVTLKQEGLKP